MKILFAVASLILIATFIEGALGIEVSSLSQESQTVYPHIVEYINDFKINTNDLEKALDNQLRNITVNNVKTSYAQIINSTVSLSHYGSDRRLEYLTPLKIKVINDTFTAFVMFNIRVLHILGGKNYTCNVSIPLVYVNYTKEVDLNTGNSIVSGLSSTYSSRSFKQAVCKESQSSKDKTRIEEAVNSTQGSSIYIQLKKNFDRMQEYFTNNSKNQHLSKIYEKNPYQYDYYGYKININVSTIQASKFGQNGVQNMISGSIPGTSKTAVAPPDYEEGFTSFYSIQFLQNIVAYSQANYAGWKNIKLNKDNMRTRVFKFRLLDFQYLIPAVLNKYPTNYISPVEIVCNIQNVKELVIDEKSVRQNIDWRCLGSFQVKQNIRETFLNFAVSAQHILNIRAETSQLVVYVDQVKISKYNFDFIGEYEMIDPNTFAAYLEEGLFQFRVYTIGTYFHINSPNQRMKLVPNRGIWIG